MAATQPRPPSGLFPGGSAQPSSFRSALFSSPEDELRQSTFRQLKPHCTALLGSSPLTPHTLPTALTSLHHIHIVLTSLATPEQTLAQSLISYVFFPITQLLQRNPPTSLPPSVREGILNVLAVLVRHWHGEGRIGVREQIWKMMIGWWKVGGLADKEGGVKAWVTCLDSIVRLPVSDEPAADDEVDVAQLGGDVEAAPVGLQAEMKELVQRDTFLPVLGETLSLLIGICQSSPSPLQPLLLLRYMLDHYLLDSPRMLATILPGAVSTMCKVVSPQTSARGGRGVQGEVVKEAIGVLGDVVVGCFSREVVAGIEGADGNGSGLGTLEELNDWVEDEDGQGWKRPKHATTDSSGDASPLSTSTAVPPSPAHSSTSFSTSSTRINRPPSPLVTLSESWLHASASQVLPALVSLSHLKRHPNPIARQALADLASKLLEECLSPLESSVQVLVGFLLTLSVDEFPSVHRRATSGLERVLQDASKRPILLPVIKTHLTNSLTTLPLLLQQPHQASAQKILDLSLQITAVSLLRSSTSLLQGLLGPLGGVQRWGSGLLDCLEFERSAVDGEGAENGMRRVAELAWQGVESSDSPSTIPDGVDTAFPRLDLRNIPDPRTAKAFETMLVSLGRAGGVDALFSVEHFISVARASSARATQRGVAAVWCAGRILEGITTSIRVEEGAEEGGKIGPQSKKLRKAVRGIVRSLVEMDEEQDDQEVDPVPDTGNEDAPSSSTAVANPSDSRLPTEYSKGYNALTTLLDRPLATTPSTSSTSNGARPDKLPSHTYRPLLTCLSLTVLSQSASILSTSFRPLLLSTLYFLLSHLGSPSSLVRTFASVALARVAYHTGYASVQNLVMDNVDYVINVVSQRLTSERLSPAAPLVLISMIRLVGEPIVPLVHDIVDEVFDALDDFHGYETVASTLLAVLDTLMKVMANETSGTVATDEGSKPGPSSRVERDQPRPRADLDAFKHWFTHRGEAAQAEIDDLLSAPPPAAPDPTPQEPWGPSPTDQPPGSENLDDDDDPSNPSPSSLPPQDPGNDHPPPTRSQSVCVQILSKALFFLTHASPFIRARVLSLITSGIQVLGPAGLERELLPVVNKAWPFVLNRMSPRAGRKGGEEEEPYVVLEAARVVEALSREVGEYMGGRIRDEGWPKLKRILGAQVERDGKASLARRRPGGNGEGRNPLDVLPKRSTHSTSYKLYASILETLAHVARSTELPWKTRWEVVVAVRPFLWEGVEGDLGDKARRVLSEVGKRDGNMVWSALRGSVGVEGGEVGAESMAWLEEKGWGVERGAEEVLEALASLA